MIFKKKLLLLTLFLIIIFQTFLFANNKQKTTFRYFKWTLEEISIGKLISISFISGLFVSTLLNTTAISFKKLKFEKVDEKYDTQNNEESVKSNIEIPPQRDIRDAQPTISVNYRVVKNMEEKNLKREKNNSNETGNNDDWDIIENDW